MSHEYVGNLETYWETGYEDTHLAMLHDDRGLHGEDNKYHSLSWAYTFNNGDVLIVYDKEGKEVEWEGKITKDRAKTWVGFLSFYPEEVAKETWELWFKEERRAKVQAIKKIEPDPEA